MKKIITTITLLLTLNASASILEDAHTENLYHHDIPTSDELGIYDDVQDFMEKGKKQQKKKLE